MTFEEARNAHNDINQWSATREFSGCAAPSDRKALWQTAASNNMAKDTPPSVCVHVDWRCARIDVLLRSCKSSISGMLNSHDP